MTDCPPNANDELRAENQRLKSQFAELIDWVAEARDKTHGEAEREPDPDTSVMFGAMNIAYESVLAKAEVLAHPPDPAIEPEREEK